MTSPAHQNVTFPSNGRQAHGYLALPASGRGPGVIVIQEWWGLTDHIRDVADRLAAAGFVALAPDLYGGRTTHDAAEAARLMQALPVEQAAVDLSGAVDYLLGHDAVTSQRVGAVGFCMGGGFVLVLAAREGDRIGAAVPFYGVGAHEGVDLSGVRAPVLGHYASEDTMMPPARVHSLADTLRGAGAKSVDLRVYDGAGHAFFNDQNLIGTYDAELSARVWRDTLEFLRRELA